MQASFYRNRYFAGHFVPPDSAAVRSVRRCKRFLRRGYAVTPQRFAIQRIIK
jgi:hypothetical protein